VKAYICDACGAVIEDPHEVGMKEFTVYAEVDDGGVFPVKRIKRVRVQLCGECFHGLHLIAEDVIRREAEECATI
jgi:hypothetical protein